MMTLDNLAADEIVVAIHNMLTVCLQGSDLPREGTGQWNSSTAVLTNPIGWWQHCGPEEADCKLA